MSQMLRCVIVPIRLSANMVAHLPSCSGRTLLTAVRAGQNQNARDHRNSAGNIPHWLIVPTETWRTDVREADRLMRPGIVQLLDNGGGAHPPGKCEGAGRKL